MGSVAVYSILWDCSKERSATNESKHRVWLGANKTH